MTNQSSQEFRSEIFALSDQVVEAIAEHSPISATGMGSTLHQERLDDFSIENYEKLINYYREILAKLDLITPLDDIDRIAKSVLIERLQTRIALFESREGYVAFGAIASPSTEIRQVFELMPKSSEADFSHIESRLRDVPRALQSWRAALERVYAEGHKTARRQVLLVSSQLQETSQGGYRQFVLGLSSVPSSVNSEALLEAASVAESGCAEMARWMREELAAQSDPEDAVGKARYEVWARNFTGANLDLLATYQWGVEELARITARAKAVGEKILPGAKSLQEVAEFCEQDSLHQINGEENLLQALKDFTENSIVAVDGKYFDIDPRMRFCDARLAPEGSAAAPYYIPPSEDFSRPGITWYPTLGSTRFNFWHIASTWYHEAVPGHHLQCATAILEKDRLSRFQRTEGWISGYGEGWALYAERFMDEIGGFADPRYELGFLSGQALRAARVVVDIGMHLKLPNFSGGIWDAESAVELLVSQAMVEREYARSEVDRYLSWPGQAISYKVGEKVWLEVREAAKARLESNFDMKSFHNYALKIGPMGLDALRAEIAEFQG